MSIRQVSNESPKVLATAAAYCATGLVAFLLWLGFVMVAQLEEVGRFFASPPPSDFRHVGAAG